MPGISVNPVPQTYHWGWPFYNLFDNDTKGTCCGTTTKKSTEGGAPDSRLSQVGLKLINKYIYIYIDREIDRFMRGRHYELVNGVINRQTSLGPGAPISTPHG